MSATAMRMTAPLSAETLRHMAQDRSRAGRLQLVEGLIDLYLQPAQQLTGPEMSEFGSFINDVFTGDVPRDIRMLLAQRGSASSSMPLLVARQLAGDAIEVAGPILRDSPVLQDEDLLDVIGLRRTDHQLAIAERQHLNEAVADALVLTGNSDVVAVVLKNAGASLSRRGVDKCVELARQIQALRLPLIQRPEFTAEDATKLMWWLPHDLRRIIASRFGFVQGSNVAAPHVVPTAANNLDVDAMVADIMARYEATPPTVRETELSAAWLYDRRAITPALLLDVMRQRQSIFYLALLARVLQLPMATIQNCINPKSQNSGSILAVLCRALQMDKAQFASAVMLLCANEGQELQPTQLEASMAAYDRLTEMRAQTMIRAWRANPALLKSRV